MKTTILLECIELEKQSFHLIVKAQINVKPIRMVLDTGASRTCFDLNYLNELEILPEVKQTEIKSSGLGGNISQSALVNLNEFELGDFRIVDYKAISLDLTAVNQAYEQVGIDSIHGILGGDVLFQFRAVIRYDKSCLILKTRKPDIKYIRLK